MGFSLEAYVQYIHTQQTVESVATIQIVLFRTLSQLIHATLVHSFASIQRVSFVLVLQFVYIYNYYILFLIQQIFLISYTYMCLYRKIRPHQNKVK